MNQNQSVVRRANVDDLGGLRILWERAHLQVLDLEKRLTEFQLIVTMDGDLIGAVALHIDHKQGWIHSEAFFRNDDAVEGRPLLWGRLQTLVRNHGLIRLWTRETSPFWQELGFVKPTDEMVAAMPPGFQVERGNWLTLGLRDESEARISVEKEFELFQQAQRANTEELLARAKQLKVLVVSVLLLLSAAAVLAALLFVVKQRGTSRPPSRPALWQLEQVEPSTASIPAVAPARMAYNV